MTSLLGVFVELERDLIVQRISEGRAKADGKHMGRPKTLGDKERKRIRELAVNLRKCQYEQVFRNR
jgi:DNA invertase Pin-like site-specific DNA recombinase